VAPFWPLVVPIVVAYFIVCEAAFGLTPGKGLAGLRVTRVDGARAGFWPVVVRNLLRPIEAWDSTVWLGGIVILLSSRRQRIGDHLAGTVVADVRSVPASYLSRDAARRRALWCALGIPLAYAATILLAYVNPMAVVADRAWTGKTPSVNSSDLTALLPQTATVTDRWSVSGPYRQGMLGGFLTYKVRYEVLTGGLHGSRQGHTCYATARLKWANSYSGWLEGWAPYDLNTSCLGSTLHTTA